jgi:hypothetical protein
MSQFTQEDIDNAIVAKRQEEMKTSDQLTLGEILLKLEPILKKQETVIEKYGKEASVKYDFGRLSPTYVSSWRGDYRELALDYVGTNNKKPLTISMFYEMLKDAIGKIFTGYKGGDFLMGKNTPVWVSNYGESTCTAVIDILDEEHTVIIVTAYREY